jgi:iron complex transport system substrate-binding protein
MPSLTEDLFAIGAGPQVVGVSQYTDDPPAAKRLPVVASYASVATERIVALRPDLVVGIPPQAAETADLRRAGIRTVFLHDDAYDDLFRDLRALGDLTGHRAGADALAARLRERTARLVAAVPPRARRPSVFVVLDDEPIYTVGHGSYINRLIALAGGHNAADDVRQPYARYSAEALVAKQPDIVLLGEGVRLDRLLARPPWNALRAVRTHRVYVVPEGVSLYRPGPRYNDGLAWLIAKLHRS